MSAHTPGPWTLSNDPARRVIVGAGEKRRTVCIVESWTTEPDARLLAAAPDLLAALRMVLPLAEEFLLHAPSHPDNAKLEDARAALVKAVRG